MDLSRIRYFHAVVELGGVRQAGEHLHVSGPSISRAIKQLERELGRALFQPAGRGLELTDDGRIAARWAKSVLEEVASVDRIFADREESAFRIGTFEFFMTHALSSVAEGLPTPLIVRDLEPDALEGALVDRRIDVGITVRPYPRKEVEHILAGTFQMGVYAASGVFGGLSPTTTPFAVPLDPVNDSPLFVRAQDGWPEEAHPRLAHFHVDSMEGALELCRTGRAAAFLPDFIVLLHNRHAAPHAQLQPVAWEIPAEVERRYPAYVACRRDEGERDITRHARELAKRLEGLFIRSRHA